MYYLYLNNETPVAVGDVPGGEAGYDVNTFGSRYTGDHKVEENCGTSPGSLLWDFEAAYQFGHYSARDLSAGMATGGLGWAFTDLPMQPQFWAYYDWASGSPNLGGTGEFSTFNQLFPFGHYYFGFLDEVGRREHPRPELPGGRLPDQVDHGPGPGPLLPPRPGRRRPPQHAAGLPHPAAERGRHGGAERGR